jgi:hypothetical protein
MAVFTLTKDRYGHDFKCGSTWSFLITRKAGNPAVPVDLTGMTGRIMFRQGSVDGSVVKTVENEELTLGDEAGTIAWTISATDSVLFTPGNTYLFDIELTSGSIVWQSPTMKFKTEQEITR